MNERILRMTLNADTVGLVLAASAMMILLQGVETALRDMQTNDLIWICFAAGVLGLLAARSRWNGKLTSTVILSLGMVGVWILGAGIAQPLRSLVRSTLAAGPQLYPQIIYRFEIGANDMVSSWQAIGLASSTLAIRLQAWLLGALENFRVKDILIGNMLWTLVLWLIAAWIGWFAAKRKATAALLPGAVLLTLLLWSREQRMEFLWAYVLVMLLLMGIWQYRNHVQHWDREHIDYSDSIRVDMGQYIALLVGVIALVSYVTPSISWRDIRDHFREREQATQSEVAAQSSTHSNTTSQSTQPGPKSSLPREHLLTAGVAQSQDLVMTIRTGELPPIPLQTAAIYVPRYYWRSVVYDRYDGRGWLTTSAPSQHISANQPMIAGVLSDYKLLHMNVEMQQPEGRLYWSGVLYTADIPLAVEWRLRPQSSLFADQTDLLLADMFAARTDATTYQADSLLPAPSAQQLRAAASDDYPEYIRDLYFSLPAALPPRLHRLARQITEGQPTQYDKAKAIETYLRTNYPYDLEIPAPPEGQDVADYFLFDLKRGYCDYYATAMVVLARASGIPARFVSGYAPGEYDFSNAEYVVRELHAHSWAEVYFPEIGWVEFEPTGNQPAIERQEAALGPDSNDRTEGISRDMFRAWTDVGPRTLLVVFVFAMIAIVGIAFIDSIYIARATPVAAIEILYQRFYRSARPLAGERTPAETAYEFQTKLNQNVQVINSDSSRLISRLQNDIDELTAMYQAALFSNHQIRRRDVKHALNLWKRLRWSLIVQRIKHFFWVQNKTTK